MKFDPINGVYDCDIFFLALTASGIPSILARWEITGSTGLVERVYQPNHPR